MPKCPKCKEEVDRLYAHGGYSMSFDGDEYGETEHGDDLEDYTCPECGETLFDYEDDASKFLKSGIVKLKEYEEEK